MTCCEPTIVPFNSSKLSIDYGAAMIAAHGIDPNVEVYIKDGNEYVLSTVEVKFTGTSIDIDFGGTGVGIVKII